MEYVYRFDSIERMDLSYHIQHREEISMQSFLLKNKSFELPVLEYCKGTTVDTLTLPVKIQTRPTLPEILESFSILLRETVESLI